MRCAPFWPGLAGLFLATGLAAADFAKGMAAVEAGDWDRALAEFRPLATRGDPDAQVNLGNLYMRGLGVEQSYENAHQWYEKAARSGQPVALGKLGLMHFYGLGAQEDHAEAARWFRQAADAGNADAALILAEMYRQGDGVGANRSEAYLWYSVAGELGKDEARTPRQQLAEQLSPSELNTALTHLEVWHQQHRHRDAMRSEATVESTTAPARTPPRPKASARQAASPATPAKSRR
ncbi:hypothetical protein JCM19379_06780 [Methyloparacoccus murrellii]